MRFSSFFNEEQNYIYDSDKIELVGGVVKLKAIIGTPEAYAYWKMEDNISDLVFLDSSGNSRDLALQGNYTGVNKVPAKINNGLQGISSSQGICNGGNQDFAFEYNEAFSIEFWKKFTTITVETNVSKQNSVGNFTGYGVNSQNGLFRWVIRDNTTNVIAIETLNTYNDDNFHHVVVTYDGSGSHTGMKIYVDNVLDYNTFVAGTLSGTIIDSTNFQVSGRDGLNNCLLNTSIIDEVVIYNRELTDAEVAFRWNNGFGTQDLPGSDTSFSVDNPIIKTITALTIDKVLSFLATVNEPGTDFIGVIAEVNGIDYYWDGVSFVESTGYPEVNTITEMVTNISNLTFEQRTLFNLKFYLHSNDGSTTPEILDFYYDFNVAQSSIVLNETVIYHIFANLLGEPLANIEIKVKDGFIVGNDITISPESVSVFTQVDGSWEMPIKYDTVAPSFLIWEFPDRKIKTNFVIGARVSFSELTIEEELIGC